MLWHLRKNRRPTLSYCDKPGPFRTVLCSPYGQARPPDSHAAAKNLIFQQHLVCPAPHPGHSLSYIDRCPSFSGAIVCCPHAHPDLGLLYHIYGGIQVLQPYIWRRTNVLCVKKWEKLLGRVRPWWTGLSPTSPRNLIHEQGQGDWSLYSVPMRKCFGLSALLLDGAPARYVKSKNCGRGKERPDSRQAELTESFAQRSGVCSGSRFRTWFTQPILGLKIPLQQDQLLAFSDFPPNTVFTFGRPILLNRRLPPSSPDEEDHRRWLGEHWIAMAFKPLLSTQKRWRRVNAPHLAALVRAGGKFPNGEAEMLLVDDSSENRLFVQTPSIYAATEV